MRTTLDLPDDLYRQLKAKAALEGRPMREVVRRAVERELQPEKNGRRRKVKLPLVESKRPGWLKLDNRTINELVLP